MELDLNDVLATFLIESEECLESMETSLLQLEEHPDSAPAIDEIFRAAHTIKGNSISLGFRELGTFAHAIEELLDRVRTRDLRVESSHITVLLGAVDAIRKWIPRLRLEEDCPFDDEGRTIYDRICAFRRAESSQQSIADAETNRDDPSSAGIADTKTIRVQTTRMDSLLNSMGEVAIALERVRRQADMLPLLQRRDMGEAIEDLDGLLRDVHQVVMRARMVPIGPTFRRHRRTVRDLAAAKGKQVRLDLSGEDVEVDVSVIEALSDPLMHMIRNAIDHGIEEPQVRIAAGKRAVGTLSLRAYHERGSIVVEVDDDGAGVRRDRVRDRAMAMGLPVQSLSDDEMLSLIFEPGFSTAENVTETSGRGVGMDVVRRNVEKVRGRVSVESTDGLGTTLMMRLPLTLAVIPGFVVSVGSEFFVIPLSEVDECLACPDNVTTDVVAGVMYVRGEGVPYVRLRDHFGFGGTASGREVMVIVEHDRGRAGFVVDEVVGEAQTVIKPLTSMLKNLPGVTGTAVMANGSVAMVLESAAIFREMERMSGGENAA
jgi:two-component system, chemotaxis family, sensor kinase CheA